MKKKIFSLLLLSVFSGNALAQTFTLSTTSSKLKWIGEEITTSKHIGSLQFKSGTITVKNNQPMTGKFIVDMTTLKNEDLDKPYRDRLEGHLRSDDFFSVDKFPEAYLEITTTTAKGNGSYNAQGKLTIKDIVHPVVFEITPEAEHWNAKLTFDRSKYNVRFRSGSFFENLGDKLIYDDIKIETKLVFNK